MNSHWLLDSSGLWCFNFCSFSTQNSPIAYVFTHSKSQCLTTITWLSGSIATVVLWPFCCRHAAPCLSSHAGFSTVHLPACGCPGGVLPTLQGSWLELSASPFLMVLFKQYHSPSRSRWCCFTKVLTQGWGNPVSGQYFIRSIATVSVNPLG